MGNCRKNRGFTFVELTIALTITAIVSAIIAVMIKSTAMGTSASADNRRQLVRMQALEARLSATMHTAACFLATDGGTASAGSSGYMVFWRGDTAAGSPNLAVNQSEICLIELDTTAHQLKLYQFPLNYSGTDTVYAANPTRGTVDKYWYTNAEALKSNASFAMTILANNVTSFNCVANNSTSVNANYGTCYITVNDNITSNTASVGGVIRNPATPQ